MNFNFSNNTEYTLYETCTKEMISLYGVPTKFLITEKINIDDTVFGDYSHMKTDNTKIFDIYMLPENSDDWDSGGFNVTDFGLINYENIALFASRSNFDDIIEVNKIIGNLIIFPNNKIMEITDVDLIVPGVNNLFTYNDSKNVYKLLCKPYHVKLTDELNTTDIAYNDAEQYESLDDYFDELSSDADEQDADAITTLHQTVVEPGIDNDTLVQKPYVDTSEDDVWGQF